MSSNKTPPVPTMPTFLLIFGGICSSFHMAIHMSVGHEFIKGFALKQKILVIALMTKI
jgi:hypothetical protein